MGASFREVANLLPSHSWLDAPAENHFRKRNFDLTEYEESLLKFSRLKYLGFAISPLALQNIVFMFYFFVYHEMIEDKDAAPGMRKLYFAFVKEARRKMLTGK